MQMLDTTSIVPLYKQLKDLILKGNCRRGSQTKSKNPNRIGNRPEMYTNKSYDSA